MKAVHGAAALWIAGSLAAARFAPRTYESALLEDRPIEWWSCLLFLAAGVIGMRAAVRGRRVGDALVALFCLVAGAEEVSWGQRIAGFTPPAVFLAENAQQELTLHNFASVIGQPRWLLLAVLACLGVIIPLLARGARGASVFVRLRLTPVPAPLVPWFAVAVLLLAVYPVEDTAEWTEALAGGLLLAAACASGRLLGAAVAGAFAAAVALSGWSGSRTGDPRLIECARAETAALLDDLATTGTVTSRLARMEFVETRVWSAASDEGLIRWDRVQRFAAAPCAGDGGERDRTARRAHAVDPWGMAYWIRASEPERGMRRVAVYSFGPNRRRDEPGHAVADDVRREGWFILAPAGVVRP